jgi:tape measure domain-containing protein
MARYTIDFTTNANKIVREIEEVNRKVAQVARTGKSVQIKLDAAPLRASLDDTFRQLDNQIARMQRKLANLPIGSRKFQQQATGLGITEGIRQRGGMQAGAIQLGAQAEAFDIGSVQRLQRQLEAARLEASQISPNTPEWMAFQRQIGQINVQLKASERLAESVQMQESLGAFSPGSLNALEAKLTVLRNRAREIAPNTTEWKQLNKEIVKAEKGVERQTRRPLTGGQRLGAAGGAFLYGGGLGGGAGSALGGIAGGLMGGVPGAFTGAAIGQAADNIAAMVSGMTEQAAVINRLQLGLAKASTSYTDFGQATQVVTKISQELLIPLDEAYRRFTQLRASTVALNIDTQTTGEMFTGVAAAVLAAGGSMEDVDGAMRAVVQVFSKGKLSAEELRGQIGDRLPGAVVEFAQSAGYSMQELEKEFQAGGVTLDKFVTFLKEKSKESGDLTNAMATDSEYAGARLNKAFEGMRLTVGRAFQPMGAAIQDFTTRSINALNAFIQKAIEAEMIQPGAQYYLAENLAQGGSIEDLKKQLADAESLSAKAEKVKAGFMYGDSLMDALFGSISGVNKQAAETKVQSLKEAIKQAEKFEKLTKQRAKQATEQAEDETRPKKMLDVIERREEAIANARENYEREIASIRENAIKQAEALEKRYQDQRLQDERELGRVRRDLAAAAQEEGLLRRSIGGEDPALLEQERKIGDAIRQYTEDKISREEQAQDRQIGFARELEDFKRQNADAINKANERYANAIGKIQQEYAKSVAKLIEDGSGNGAKKLAAAGKLIAAQIARASAQEAFVTATGAAIIPQGAGTYEVAGKAMTEAELLAAAEKSSPNTKTAAKAFVDATKQIEQAQKDLNASMQLTAQSTKVQLTGVSTADLDSSIQKKQQALSDSLKGINDEKEALSKQQNIYNALLSAMEAAGSESNANKRQVDEQNSAIEDQLKLIRGGMLPVLAEEELIRENIFDKWREYAQQAADQILDNTTNKEIHENVLRILQEQLDVIANQEEAYAAAQSVLRDNAGLLEAAQIEGQTRLVGQGLRAGFINEAGAAYEEQISKGVSPEVAANVARATEQLTLAKTAADALQGSINGIGSAFGEAMTTGVASLISGTATAKEVFASFLQSVGQALSQAASQMIATYIAIGIAKMFAGLSEFFGFKFSGQGPVALPGAMNPMGAMDVAGNYAPNFTFANGGIAPGGFRAFANGGVVSGPTLGLVGEGKYNEAIVPLPDGKSIPVQMRGTTARDVMGSNAPGMPQAPTLNLKFETTKINGVEYVSKEQLEMAMVQTRSQAARDGARQGMGMTLAKIQNSPQTRRQIGM